MAKDNVKSALLSKAIIIATNAHEGQFDKGGFPYIMHPMKVAAMLRTTDLELMSIAILHDVIEDTSVTYKDLRDAGISERVIEALKALTKVPGQTYQEYQEGVFANRDAMIVKMADLRHNSDIRRLKDVSEKDVARIAKYMKFYSEIKERLESVEK